MQWLSQGADLKRSPNHTPVGSWSGPRRPDAGLSLRRHTIKEALSPLVGISHAGWEGSAWSMKPSTTHHGSARLSPLEDR